MSAPRPLLPLDANGRRRLKIAFVGTHGVGKTTLCFDLAAHLKRLDLNIDLVKEVARRCPLPINVVLGDRSLHPDDVAASSLSAVEMRYEMAGLPGQVRVTTDRKYYEEHPDSVELWSPGGAVFPGPVEYSEPPKAKSLGELLRGWQKQQAE